MTSPNIRSPALEGQSRDVVLSQAQLEDFTYAVAHDFKESLRTISMFTELLARNVALDDNGRHLAQSIADGVARMRALFEGVHGLAISGRDPLKRLDLSEVAADAWIRSPDEGQALPLPVKEATLERVSDPAVDNAVEDLP